MNTKITPIDKKNGIRGEWSVYNSEKKHTIELYSSICVRVAFPKKTGSNTAHTAQQQQTFEIMEILFYPSISSFLQLFYIVGCFFLHLLLLCVSKVIKMCWRKSQWRICRYIFFFVWLTAWAKQFFIFAKDTTRFQRADECSNWRLYGKIQENEDEEKYTIFFLIFFFSLSSIFPFNLCFSARRCVPFHLLHVLVIMCSWENFCTRT